jgi:hypothetical protein
MAAYAAAGVVDGGHRDGAAVRGRGSACVRGADRYRADDDGADGVDDRLDDDRDDDSRATDHHLNNNNNDDDYIADGHVHSN